MRKCILWLCVWALLFVSLYADADEAIKTYLPDWAEDAFTLPDSIDVVGAEAFAGTDISLLLIGRGVTRIEEGAFSDCENLTKVCVLSSKAAIGKNAFGSNEITLYGYLNSTAEAYAEANGLEFERIYTYEESLMEYAASKLGTKYIRGTWDCVLYVRDCYLSVFGIKLPDSCRTMELLDQQRLVKSQRLTVTRIETIDQLKTGDIICWCNDEVEYCTHVGMYVGAGTVGGKRYTSGVFIENSNGYGEVRYNYIPTKGTGYYTRNFICAWRVLPE